MNSDLIIYLIPILISLIAVYISYKAFKRTVLAEKPVVAGNYTRGNSYVIHIQDYTPNNNLRIDKVYYRQVNKYRWIELLFNQKHLREQKPPVVEVLVDIGGNLLNLEGTFKIKTNLSVTLYNYINSMFQSKTRWYKIHKLFPNIRYSILEYKCKKQYERYSNYSTFI